MHFGFVKSCLGLTLMLISACMNSRQAKDFLVLQVTKQAALEGLPFSDIEARMMYFTESDPSSCENPVALNDEFEAQCDTSEYEAKISGLLQRAYARLADPTQKELWDEAILELRKGDHYLLVMLNLDEKPSASAFLKSVWYALLSGVQRKRS
jgi:hypothetical protein